MIDLGSTTLFYYKWNPKSHPDIVPYLHPGPLIADATVGKKEAGCTTGASGRILREDSDKTILWESVVSDYITCCFYRQPVRQSYQTL